MRTLLAAALLAVALSACSGDDSPQSSDTTVTTVLPTTSTQATTTTVAVLRYPSGDPVLPGYPLIVNVSTIDRRVASWLERNQLVEGQVVALAPGAYRPYNPAVPDLSKYLDGGATGDCLVIEQYLDPGTCWDGVQKGSAEP